MEMQEGETNASAVACQGLPPDPGLNSVGAGGPGSAAGHPCSHGWPRVSGLVCAGRENAADDDDTFARTVLAAQPEASQMTPDREVQEGTCVLPDRSQPRSPGLEATSDNSDELNHPQLLQAHKIPIAGIRRHMKQEKGVSLISAETPVVLSHMCQQLLEELCDAARLHSPSGELSADDFASVLRSDPRYSFLGMQAPLTAQAS